MKKYIPAALAAYILPVLAFADSQPFSVADATSSINSIYASTETVLLYGLVGALAAGVGFMLLGFFWRFVQRHITGRKFK